ncbi:MAG: hypothetical protein MI921_29915 [Cytophagales bacterium]|nr:hypothetical protein [Cytophagales bacterium]
MTFRVEDAEIGYDTLSPYYDDYDPNKVVKMYGDDPKLEHPKVLIRDNGQAYLYGPANEIFSKGTEPYVMC